MFLPEELIAKDQLAQGDLLCRTPELAAAIAEAHAYYANADDYTHFLVLTQSCDLVRRNGTCKSRYITICAVRPLTLAVEREMAKFTSGIEGFPFPVGETGRKILARQYLERVLNNTVDGLFFIPAGIAKTVDEHLCAFLQLSVALRVDHYDVCLAAKVAQCEEIFAAKIGSLASGLYARIATPDLAEKHPDDVVKLYKEQFFEQLGHSRVAWLSPVQKKALKKLVQEAIQESPDLQLTEQQAVAMLSDLPDEVDALADRTIGVLVRRKLLSPESSAEARSYLVNDPTFKKLARR